MADTPKKAPPATSAKAVAPAKKLDPACSTFLKNFNLSPAAFAESGCDWEVLKRIRAAHVQDADNLATVANAVAELLRQVPEVHSLKVRVKDPDHLVAKVVRKCIEKPALDVNDANYRQHITDLVGIRALHLFKGDWRPIHEYVKANWDLLEQPTAFVREGDSDESFAECECKVETHTIGYRSVHYLLKLKPTKVERVVELQVRTLFEEGWSEIDHRTRYPYGEGDPVLSQFLRIFNLLAGGADEMGTFVRVLYQSVEEHRKAADAKEAELKAMISKLNLAEEAKKELQSKLDDYLKSSRYSGSKFAVAGEVNPFADALGRFAAANPTTLAGILAQPSYSAGVTIGGIAKTCTRCGNLFTEPFSAVVSSGLCPSCMIGPITLGPR